MAVEIKIEEKDNSMRLNRWIEKHYPILGRSHLEKLLRTGQIRINKKRVKSSNLLTTGDTLRLPPFIVEYTEDKADYEKRDKEFAEKISDIEAKYIEEIKENIIFEDKWFMVVNKPSGLACQGGSGTKEHLDTLINKAFPKYDNELRLTHRLDKDTSGLIMIAKDYNAAKELTALFKAKEIEKTYMALIYDNLDEKEGVINTFMRKGVKNNKELMMVSKYKKDQQAITNYKVQDEVLGTASLIELKPETGRTHQLRVHMQYMGHPIVGDFKYSEKGDFSYLMDKVENTENVIERKLYLHAYKIEFIHPFTHKNLTLSAKFPIHFSIAMKKLGLEK